MEKIISIDLKADFGFFKKPDTNDPIYLTFNMLHKPALLGILGAILGLGGFSEAKEEEPKPKKGEKIKTILPEYFKKLNDLKIGIKPLTASHKKTPTPHFFPKSRLTFVAPIFPLPTS